MPLGSENLVESGDPLEAAWQEMLATLQSYTVTHGDCRVPQFFKENKKLGSWVMNQRASYKNKTLSSERIRRLQAIGFEMVVEI